MSKNVEYRKNEMDMDDITWYVSGRNYPALHERSL